MANTNSSQFDILDSEVTGTNNGVTVTVTETDGLLTNLSVRCTLLGAASDTVNAKTINGVRNRVDDLKGSSSDSFSQVDPSVFGNANEIVGLKSRINDIKRISDSKIRSLFC